MPSSRGACPTSVGRSRTQILPRISLTQGIPLLTCNGQSGKRGDDGVLDSVLHRKNFLTQASWPRVMVALVLDCAAVLFECAASGKPVPDIGAENVIILFSGNWDFAASAIYPRLDYEDAITESTERRISDPTERTSQAKAALRAFSAGSVPKGVLYSLEQAQQAVQTEEALLRRMREVGGTARLRPSTLRCSAGKDATGCAVLTSCDYRIAARDGRPDDPPLPACTGVAPERRSGTGTGEATLIYGLGCVLHGLVFVSARDRRTHVPPPPALALDFIALCKAADTRRRPSLEALAAHPFLASAHLFLGLPTQAAFVDQIRQLRTGAVREAWWRRPSIAIPGHRAHRHPVGKVGGRHKHLSVAPPSIIGAASFATPLGPPSSSASSSSSLATTSSSSSSFASSASSSRASAAMAATAVAVLTAGTGVGGRLATSRRAARSTLVDGDWTAQETSAFRPARASGEGRMAVARAARRACPSSASASASAAASAAADMRRADLALSAGAFPALASSSFHRSCCDSRSSGAPGPAFCSEDGDEEDVGSDDLDRISVESAKPATAADVAGLGLDPRLSTGHLVWSSSVGLDLNRAVTADTTSSMSPPATAVQVGFGPDRVLASSRALSPRARADFLSACTALATANAAALADMASAPFLVPVTSQDSTGLDGAAEFDASRWIGQADGCETFGDVLGDGIAVTASAGSAGGCSISSEAIVGATDSGMAHTDMDEDAWGIGNVSAFTVDAAMGRVGKRSRDAGPTIGSSSSASASASSSGLRGASDSASSGRPLPWHLPDPSPFSSATSSSLASQALMPQSHLASSTQGIASVSLVPFARSKPAMPAMTGREGRAADTHQPLLPHGLPDAAAAAFAAQPLRVATIASPDASPGVTTIAPSPTYAEFGHGPANCSSWQPRATRPVIATDGTPELSHPALCRQITGGH